MTYGWGDYILAEGPVPVIIGSYNRWVDYKTKKDNTPVYYRTIYFFDANDRLAAVYFRDADDVGLVAYKYTYDGIGNLVHVEKPDAETIEYTYNGLNQMTQETFGEHEFNDFEYCCCSLVKHQQTIPDNGGELQLEPYELTMDKLHRLTREQYPDSGEPQTEYFDYKYDRAGRRVEMTDPKYGRAANNPKPMRWEYDQDGNLLDVGRSEDTNYLRNQGEDYGVSYDNRGRIWKVTYPGENNQPVMEVEYGYTDGGQVTKIVARDVTKGVATDIYCMVYEYDENGRKIRQVIKEKESDADTEAYYVTSFNYDSRDMLTEEKYLRWNSGTSAWMIMYWGQYKYDTAGNMVERIVKQIVNGSMKIYKDEGFTYSRGYQLMTFIRNNFIDAESRTFALTYDANGNMTHIEQSTAFTDSFYDITEMEFQFDLKNRMTQYRFGGSGRWYEIKYDALGRVRERVDLTPDTTKYYYDGRSLLQQLNDSNDVEFDYFRGPTGLMRQWEENVSPTKRFYIKDPLGTVWALVDTTTLDVERYNYNAWGEHLDKDDTDFPTDANLMRYIGCRVERFGNSTGQTDVIYHFSNRFYIPSLMRFLQREPNSLSRDYKDHPYSYADNAPVIKSDPTGLSPGSFCPRCGGSGPTTGQPPELWPTPRPPLIDPHEFGLPFFPGPPSKGSGKGNCCRFHPALHNMLEGQLYSNRLDWLTLLLIPYSGGHLYEDEVVIDSPYGPITYNCYFRVFWFYFFWYCEDVPICWKRVDNPCYKIGGNLENIGDWVGTTEDVGFIWRNRINRLLTRSIARVELVTCKIGDVDVGSGSYAQKLGFEDPWGLNPYKIFCLQDICNCAEETSVSLDVGRSILEGIWEGLGQTSKKNKGNALGRGKAEYCK